MSIFTRASFSLSIISLASISPYFPWQVSAYNSHGKFLPIIPMASSAWRHRRTFQVLEMEHADWWIVLPQWFFTTPMQVKWFRAAPVLWNLLCSFYTTTVGVSLIHILGKERKKQINTEIQEVYYSLPVNLLIFRSEYIFAIIPNKFYIFHCLILLIHYSFEPDVCPYGRGMVVIPNWNDSEHSIWDFVYIAKWDVSTKLL